MYAERIDLHAAPGLPDGIALPALSPGLNVLVGPNASGKSTLASVLRGALWADLSRRGTHATMVWRQGDTSLTAVLAHGQVHWNPQKPPTPSVESAGQYRLDLATLLRATESDTALARSLVRELAGGYDLDEAQQAFHLTPGKNRRVLRELEAARDALAEAERRTDTLIGDEARLDALRRQRDEAQAAARRLDGARRLREVLEARTRAVEAEAKLAEMPEGTGRLSGDEADRLTTLEANVRKRRDELAARRRELKITTDEIEALDLRAPLDDVTRGRLETLAAQAEEQDRATTTASRAAAAASAEEKKRHQEIFEELSRGTPLTRDEIRALESALQERRNALVQQAQAEAQVAFWSRHAQSADPSALPSLREGISALRAWLRVAAPASAASNLPPRNTVWLLLGIGLLVALLGAALAFVVGSVGWVLFGVGTALLGAGIALYVVAGRASTTPAGDPRATWQSEAERHGVRPSSWKPDDVAQQLEALEAQADAATLASRAKERLDDARQFLAQTDKLLHQAGAALQGTLQELGLQSTFADLDLMVQAREVSAWLESRARAEAARTEAQATADDRDTTLASLSEALGDHAEGPLGEVAAARALVNALLKSDRDLQELQRRQGDQQATVERAADELTSSEEALAAFWKRAGVDDAQALHERLKLLPAWQEAEQARAVAKEEARGGLTRLEAEALLEDLPVDAESATVPEVDALILELQETAAGANELIAEVAALEDRLAQARRGTALEDARAALFEQQARVDEARERLADDLLAQVVLEDARAHQNQDQAPSVLRRARTWFERFTHHGWRLDVDPEHGDFRATDLRDGQPRELAQLSDGTRIQLLLAVRLAAIEEAESAVGRDPLPLVLDEALANTDPTRFQAIAEVVFDLVDAGRQVLYLTSQPQEAALWRLAAERLGRAEPTVHALGTADHATPEALDALDDVTVVPVPAPDGRKAAEWAQELRVHPPSGRRDADAWHLVYLLPDHLDEVHRLLEARVEAVGPWRAAARRGLGERLVNEATARLLDVRADLLDATLDSWRVGRGEPVTWEDVETSGAVTSAFEDRVRALLDDHAEHAAVFAEAVRDLPRFRSSNADDLYNHLVELGRIDDRAPLTDSEVVTRALARVAPRIDAGVLDIADATAFVERILRLLDAA